MRRTRCRLLGFVLDPPSKDLKTTARRVEHWRTKRLQESKTTTNSYHKEQYINAFLEAQSAALVHRHAVEAKSAAPSALVESKDTVSTAQDLTALALELERRFGKDSCSRVSGSSLVRLSEAPSEHSLQLRKKKKSADVATVEFGAWRSAEAGDARLRQRVRSVDMVRHCVIREARTPPSLSLELLQRALPVRAAPAVQRLLTYLHSRSFRAATKPVSYDRLQASALAALQALRHSRELQRTVSLYTIYALGCHRDWQTVSQFVLWLHAQWPSLVDVGATSSSDPVAELQVADASHFAALLFDTVRWAAPKNAAVLPSLGDIEHFCSACCSLLRKNVTAAGSTEEAESGSCWAPVVCAPMLSVAGLKESLGNRVTDDIDQLEGIVQRFCIHRVTPASYRHRTKQAQPLAYMPALAWGEYLRALHRCGASLAALQSATDRITDATVTRHATQLLSSTHVWNAYLACTPGAHALEVYEMNLSHYHVTATPATVAAVMTALLNEATAESTAQARVLWNRLRQGQPSRKMVLGTCSTVKAHVRLLEAEGDAAAVRDLLTSYEDLYECFGVSAEWHEQQLQLLRERVGGAEVTMADGLRLLHRACAAHPLLIPPSVQVALVEAARRTTAAAAAAASARNSQEPNDSGEPSTAASLEETIPELTAEDLAAML